MAHKAVSTSSFQSSKTRKPEDILANSPKFRVHIQKRISRLSLGFAVLSWPDATNDSMLTLPLTHFLSLAGH